MRNFFCFCFSLCLLLSFPYFSRPWLAQDSSRDKSPILKGLKLKALQFEFPSLRKVKLGHGAALFLLEDAELPLVNLSFYFPNGYRHETIQRAGLLQASLELLEKGGTKSKKGAAFSQALTEMGIQLKFHQGDDSWGLNIKVIRQNFRPALALIKELLLEPALPLGELKDIKNAMLVKINKQYEKPSQILTRYLAALLYPGLRRGYSLKKEDLSRIGIESIKQEIEMRTKAEGMYITATGDIRGLDLKKNLGKLLNSLSLKTKNRDLLEAEKVKQETLRKVRRAYKSKILLLEKNVSQAVIGLAFSLPAHRHSDFYALQVANYVLGGGSFTSRLMRKIRVQKALAYYAYSHNFFGSEDGFFRAGCGTQSEKAAESLKILLSEIVAMKKGVSLEELSLAKDAILNSFVFQFDSAQRILSQEVRFRLHKMPPNYLREFPSKVRAISLKDIDSLRSYWDPAEFYIVLVGPAKLKRELEKIAPVVVKKVGEDLL